MSVSVILVTRNHEQCLGRAVRSAAGFAVDVVVADTGSTDGTVEVARSLRARVCPVEWKDDFSAALNFAIHQARGDWVFLLNPDEEVDQVSGRRLAEAAARPDLFAGRVRVQQQLRPDRPEYGTAGWEPRLYRKAAGVRYRGRLHPAFERPLEALAAVRGQRMENVNATVVRHAYLSTPTPDKLRWVVRLLEAELRDRPGQLHFLIELGRNLLWLNDPRGHEVLAEAAAQVRAAIAEPYPPSPAVGSLLEYLLAVSAGQNQTGFSREEARELAGRWFPHTPPVLWAVAAERFAAGDHAAAVAPLERLVGMGRTGAYDTSGGGFTPEIVGPAAVMNLGLCYLHLGRWDEAKTCFAGVMHDPARKDAAMTGFALAERRQRPT